MEGDSLPCYETDRACSLQPGEPTHPKLASLAQQFPLLLDQLPSYLFRWFRRDVIGKDDDTDNECDKIR